MITITKRIEKIPIGHRLMQYSGGCANIHGHNIDIDISLSSNNELNDSGFVLDFGEIKKGIGKKIKKYFDHAFLANPFDRSTIEFLQREGYACFIMPIPVTNADTFKQLVGYCNPTAENIANLIFNWTLDDIVAMDDPHVHDHVSVKEVKIYESTTALATVDKVNHMYASRDQMIIDLLDDLLETDKLKIMGAFKHAGRFFSGQ